MKIGIDLSVLRHGAGAGTALYAYNLTRALLRHSATERLVALMAARESPDGTAVLAELERLGTEVVRGRGPGRLSPDGAWWLPWPRRLPEPMPGLDVFHLGELFFPRRPAPPTVATIHDLTDALFPELHTRLNRRLHARRLRWIEAHATRVITVSEATRRDLLQRSTLDPRRVRTVHEARAHGEVELSEAAVQATLERFGLADRRYILCVGTLEPRKNHRRLVEAFGRLPERHSDIQLVLAGGRGWHADPILEAVDASPARERIRVTGRVSAPELHSLYVGAMIFAYPSLYEGFGLPLLEAMAAGVPVLTADRSSLPEVAGDAAVLVDPDSSEAIARGLLDLLDRPERRQELAEAGRGREAGFTWDRTADATIAIYRAAIEERT